jgi:hypothetical protein
MGRIFIEYSQPSDDNILGIAESLHSVASLLADNHGTEASMASEHLAFHALWHLHQCLGEIITESAFNREKCVLDPPSDSPN